MPTKIQKQTTLPLNQRLVLWHPRLTTEKDELGALIDVPGVVAHLWGRVAHWRATEQRENGMYVPMTEYRITIRYRENINEAMYFVYKGRELQINTIENVDEGNAYLELRCTERRKPLG